MLFIWLTCLLASLPRVSAPHSDDVRDVKRNLIHQTGRPRSLQRHSEETTTTHDAHQSTVQYVEIS